MMMVLLSLLLSAHAAPTCRVLHVVNAHARRALVHVEGEVAALLRQSNPECALATERLDDLAALAKDTTRYDLVVLQSFPPDATSGSLGVLRDRVNPGARVLVLSDGLPSSDPADVRRLLESLDVADPSLFLGEAHHWPPPPPDLYRMTVGQFLMNLLSAPAYTAGALTFFDVNAWGWALAYSAAAYAGLKAVDALYAEARRLRPGLREITELFDLPGTRESTGTLATDLGLIGALAHTQGIATFWSPVGLGIGGFGFVLNHYFHYRGRVRQAAAHAEAVRTQLNKGYLHAVTGDEVESLAFGATDPRLYACQRDLTTTTGSADAE